MSVKTRTRCALIAAVIVALAPAVRVGAGAGTDGPPVVTSGEADEIGRSDGLPLDALPRTADGGGRYIVRVADEAVLERTIEGLAATAESITYTVTPAPVSS